MPTRHGHNRRGKTTKEYRAWYSLRRRCSKTAQGANAADYRDRGITVCERWQVFENFLEDVGHCPSSKHSIDRIDNDKGYRPGNVKWSTRIEQNRNTRRNAIFEWAGMRLSLAEWCERARMNYYTVHSRLTKHHWPWPQALYTPVGQHYRIKPLVEPAPKV